MLIFIAFYSWPVAPHIYYIRHLGFVMFTIFFSYFSINTLAIYSGSVAFLSYQSLTSNLVKHLVLIYPSSQLAKDMHQMLFVKDMYTSFPVSYIPGPSFLMTNLLVILLISEYLIVHLICHLSWHTYLLSVKTKTLISNIKLIAC